MHSCFKGGERLKERKQIHIPSSNFLLAYKHRKWGQSLWFNKITHFYLHPKENLAERWGSFSLSLSVLFLWWWITELSGIIITVTTFFLKIRREKKMLHKSLDSSSPHGAVLVLNHTHSQKWFFFSWETQDKLAGYFSTAWSPHTWEGCTLAVLSKATTTESFRYFPAGKIQLTLVVLALATKP